MTNGDGLRRITRKRKRENEEARKDFEHYYKKGMEGDPPRKRRATASTSKATDEERKREQEAKEMLSGERSSVKGKQSVMNVIVHASQSILEESLSENRRDGSSRKSDSKQKETEVSKPEDVFSEDEVKRAFAVERAVTRGYLKYLNKRPDAEELATTNDSALKLTTKDTKDLTAEDSELLKGINRKFKEHIEKNPLSFLPDLKQALVDARNRASWENKFQKHFDINEDWVKDSLKRLGIDSDNFKNGFEMLSANESEISNDVVMSEERPMDDIIESYKAGAKAHEIVSTYEQFMRGKVGLDSIHSQLRDGIPVDNRPNHIWNREVTFVSGERNNCVPHSLLKGAHPEWSPDFIKQESEKAKEYVVEDLKEKTRLYKEKAKEYVDKGFERQEANERAANELGIFDVENFNIGNDDMLNPGGDTGRVLISYLRETKVTDPDSGKEVPLLDPDRPVFVYQFRDGRMSCTTRIAPITSEQSYSTSSSYAILRHHETLHYYAILPERPFEEAGSDDQYDNDPYDIDESRLQDLQSPLKRKRSEDSFGDELPRKRRRKEEGSDSEIHHEQSDYLPHEGTHTNLLSIEHSSSESAGKVDFEAIASLNEYYHLKSDNDEENPVPSLSDNDEENPVPSLSDLIAKRFLDSKKFLEMLQQPNFSDFLQFFVRSVAGIKWFRSDNGRSFLCQHAHKFIETKPGEEWYREYGDKWLRDTNGQAFLLHYAHEFIKTKLGEAWFREHGDEWLRSDYGGVFLQNHALEFIKTNLGEAWFREHGDEWLRSDYGQVFLQNHALEFIKTKLGEAWFREHGDEWLRSDYGGVFLQNHALEFIKTKLGEAWFREHGDEWLRSYYGQ